MARDKVTEISKRLSWLLRHAAAEQGLPMDAAGWVPVESVLRHLRLSLQQLDDVVRLNNKGRLEIDGGLVRACQGHSREGLPITLEALEASWQVYDGPGPVWHGTHVGAVGSIAREGISAVGRTHVHLAEAIDSKVGKRANVDVMIEVSIGRLSDEGLTTYRSGNGVVLVRHVPPSCLSGLRPMTRNAEAREPELRAQLGC
jgi:putative RNA 2'-phosphotransferase